MKYQAKLTTALLIGLTSIPAFALKGPGAINYEGRVYNADGVTPSTQTVYFILRVMNPAADCILREEKTAAVNLSTSNGYFSVAVGQGAAHGNDPGLNLTQVFANGAPVPGKKMDGTGCLFTPVDGQGRVLQVVIDDGTTETALTPNVSIGAVPSAITADSLQGKSPSEFLQPSAGALTQANLESVFNTAVRVSQLNSVIDGTSNFYMRAGDSMAQVPGRSTNPASPTAGSLWYDTASNQLKYYNGSAVQTLGTGATGAVSSVTAVTPLSVTGGTATPSISIQQASASTSGYLTMSDWTIFNQKMSSNLSSAHLWVGNASNTATAVVPTGDMVMSNAGAFTVMKIRNNAVSGNTPTTGQVFKYDGAEWTPGHVSLSQIRKADGTAQVPGACSAGQALTYNSITDQLECFTLSVTSAQVSGLGTAATKNFGTNPGDLVELDGTGKIPSSLLPAPGGGLWATSSTNLYYNGGNVGINTSSPSVKLEVNGDLKVSGRVLAGTALTASLSSCGTSASLTGNASRGKVTPGAGATSCSISLGTGYPVEPVCVVSWVNTGADPGVALRSSVSFASGSATLDVVSPIAMTGYAFNYICMQ
jgi:hypothetical protein